MCPVFGFNTDIRYGDTVYHVQTEAREAEHTVQTAIFVRGRCIEKQECSYAGEAAAPGFSDTSFHDILTRQHKFVVSCIREGKLEALSNVGLAGQMAATAPVVENHPVAPSPAATPPTSVETAQPGPEHGVHEGEDSGKANTLGVASAAKPAEPGAADHELKLVWLASESAFRGDLVVLRYRLIRGSQGIEGAKIIARLELSNVPAGYARTVSDCEGESEVAFKLPAAAQNSNALSVTVQASYAGQLTARRFRLSRS